MRRGSLVRFLPKTADGSYMSTKIEVGSYGTVLDRHSVRDNGMDWVSILFDVGIYDIRYEDLREVTGDRISQSATPGGSAQGVDIAAH